ncbi:MAG: NADAR family protein [Lachnospiraceae bacterium]|nr:NADAR family protein [Lachnospiraceae bacterium]
MRRIICFHNPEEENGYLSNWFLSDFQVDGKWFTSMEQYMMYSKAMLFQDVEIAERIMSTTNVGKIKALGRVVKQYNDVVWNGMRQIIIYEGLLAKFSQNEELKKLLLSTDNAILAECAVQDRIWGIGCSMKDEKRFDMDSWNGQNLLGFALIKVRSDLQKMM